MRFPARAFKADLDQAGEPQRFASQLDIHRNEHDMHRSAPAPPATVSASPGAALRR